MPRYVILHHTGSSEGKKDHYDLMLERNGVLKTWIVEDPGLKGGGAVESVDHRLAYVSYEGSVSGGRGSVRRVAAGTFEVLTWQERVIRLRFPDFILTLSIDDNPGDGAVWTVTRSKPP